MSKSIYDCNCGGRIIRSHLLGMDWIRECLSCGIYAVYGKTKREADRNYKTKEIRQHTKLGSKLIRKGTK